MEDEPKALVTEKDTASPAMANMRYDYPIYLCDNAPCLAKAKAEIEYG